MAQKQARLLVRYGNHTVGETIRGALAEKLIKEDMAIDTTPKAKKAAPKKADAKKKAPANKAQSSAPANKTEDGFKP